MPKNTKQKETTKPSKKIVEPPKPSFTHEELRNALFDVQDKLGRVLIPFFVLGKTARHIMRNEESFAGDEDIHIGVLKPELNPMMESLLDTFIPDLERSEFQYSYYHNNVPVVIDIIHNKYKVFEYPDRKFFDIEEFLIPNPFELYWQQRDYIK